MRGAVAARSVRIGQAQGARHRTRSSCSLAGLSPALPCRTFGAHDQRPVLEHTPPCGLNAAADSAFGDGARGAQGDDEASYFIKQLRALPWNRAAIWLLVAAAFTQVKDFFGIGMGVFILTFIGRSLTFYVQRSPYLNRFFGHETQRKLLVLSYFVTIACIISVFGVLTIPYMVREGADFIVRLQSENIWVVVLEKARLGLGDQVMEQLEKFLLLASQENVMKMSLNGAQEGAAANSAWTSERLVTLGAAVQSMLQGYTEKAILFTSGLLSWVTHFTLQVSISLIVSFMFLWDWPNISRGVASLKESRVSNIFNEVAPSVLIFAQLFGKALQAQTQIAVCNTVLTGVGLYTLGIPGILLLSLFVFLCSFIPVAGCIISTVPIGFVALTEYGFLKLALSMLMVFGVHAIEAYGLNPAIYSAHLQLHPLLVLTVLVMAEHSMGVWGLLLAVPMTVFALDYCIRFPQLNAHGVAEKELEYVTGFSVDEYEGYTPTPGFTPADMPMDGSPEGLMSPEARRLTRRSRNAHKPVSDRSDGEEPTDAPAAR